MPRMNSSKASSSWAPLSFPSAVIFASSRGSRSANKINDPGIATIPTMQRTADPLFPLHRDVVAAAVRELFIIEKKIDHRTMKIVKDTDVMEEDRLLSDHSCEEKEHVVVSRSGSDNEADVNDLLLQPQVKRLRLEVSSEPHVVPIEGDIFDHARFANVESLVDFIIERAMLIPNESSSDIVDSDQISLTGKEQHNVSAGPPSIRKVSDASDDMEQHSTDFSTCVLSLVRSNIVVLHKSPSRSKLTKLTSQSESDSTVPTSILSFLRNPRLHREQQEDTVFALPKFVEASIDNEYTMRARAHAIILSIMKSFCGNSMNMSVRVFLGYTSAKTPSTDRVYEILANVLFDVSHAMFAFIHTQEEMTRGMASSTEGVADVRNNKSMDMQIKTSLFDGRALKRIGGFEPSALLPLALGIHRCRQTKTSWEEYATSEEGRMAMSVHSSTQIEVSNHERKRKCGAIMVNNSLLELGKKRRGRRGKSSISQL